MPAGPLLILLAANLAALVRAATGSMTWFCTLGAGSLLVTFVGTFGLISCTLGAGCAVASVTGTLVAGCVPDPIGCTLGAGCLWVTGGVIACLVRRGDRRSSALAMSGVSTSLSIDLGGWVRRCEGWSGSLTAAGRREVTRLVSSARRSMSCID